MNPSQIWEEFMCSGIEAVTAPRLFLDLWLCTMNIYQAVRELNSQKVWLVETDCIIIYTFQAYHCERRSPSLLNSLKFY